MRRRRCRGTKRRRAVRCQSSGCPRTPFLIVRGPSDLHGPLEALDPDAHFLQAANQPAEGTAICAFSAFRSFRRGGRAPGPGSVTEETRPPTTAPIERLRKPFLAKLGNCKPYGHEASDLR